jgi:hypothetical protein
VLPTFNKSLVGCTSKPTTLDLSQETRLVSKPDKSIKKNFVPMEQDKIAGFFLKYKIIN